MPKLTLVEWLTLIRSHGSIAEAARSQGISRQALSKKFTRLPIDDPLSLEYKKLARKTKRGAKRVYDSKKTVSRLKKRRYRERLKNKVDN